MHPLVLPIYPSLEIGTILDPDEYRGHQNAGQQLPRPPPNACIYLRVVASGHVTKMAVTPFDPP